jgi:hypothetical protein
MVGKAETERLAQTKRFISLMKAWSLKAQEAPKGFCCHIGV